MTRPIHVVHLLSGDLWAGAEVAAFHLITALAERSEILVRVVALNDGEFARRLQAAGIPVAVEPEGGRSFAALLAAVRRRLADSDLVHAHRYKENLLAALAGRPWIATQHGRAEGSPRPPGLRMRAYAALDLLLKRLSARRTIAVSSEIQHWLAARIGRRRTVTVWNGIRDPALDLDVAAWSQRRECAGFAGRLVAVKGLELAIDAVAACEGLELEVVGDGPERAALESRAKAAGASGRIRFVGFQADPIPRMASWKALLLTSHQEGNPVCVLEALALGTPIVAAQLPGVVEMLDGRGGWVRNDRDPREWAAFLRRFLNDVDVGTEASRGGRERYLEAFTASHAAEQTLAVYREALG